MKRLAGIAAIVFFAIAFLLLAIGTVGTAPWNVTGFTVLGLIGLSVFLVL